MRYFMEHNAINSCNAAVQLYGVSLVELALQSIWSAGFKHVINLFILLKAFLNRLHRYEKLTVVFQFNISLAIPPDEKENIEMIFGKQIYQNKLKNIRIFWSQTFEYTSSP